MQRTLKILLFIFIVFGCSSVYKIDKSSKIESPYFEGEMRFTIQYDSIPSYLTSKYLNDAVGSHLVIIFKNGNHRKDYLSPDGDIISQRFLNLKNQKSYSIKPNEDTVLWFDINKQDSRTKYTKLNDTIFKGFNCIPIIAKTLTPNPRNKDEDLEIKSTHYFAKDLTINPVWFSDYSEGNLNEMVKITKSVVIATYNKGPFWNTSIEYDTIIWRNVKDEELSIEKLKGRPHKEL